MKYGWKNPQFQTIQAVYQANSLRTSMEVPKPVQANWSLQRSSFQFGTQKVGWS